MFTLTLPLLACASTYNDSVVEPATEYAAVVYEEDGLPDCVRSISDEAFCSGWGVSAALSNSDGANVPDWLVPYQGFVTTDHLMVTGDLDDVCANDEQEALERAESVLSHVPDWSMVDPRDPRWFDVLFPLTSADAYKSVLVPRCAYYSHFSDMSVLTSQQNLWSVSELPPNRLAFVDQARRTEVNRADYSRGLESIVLYALASSLSDEWAVRSCRINAEPAHQDDSENWVHEVWQTDYTMDQATGDVRLQSERVREVTCPEYIKRPAWYTAP